MLAQSWSGSVGVGMTAVKSKGLHKTGARHRRRQFRARSRPSI